MLSYKLKVTKAIYLVKCLVNKLSSFVSQRIYSKLNGGYLGLSLRLEWHFYLIFRLYLDETFRILNKRILSNELSK